MVLTGYTGAVAALPGDSIDLYLSTDGGPGQQTLTVTRVAGSETTALTAQVSPQSMPTARAWEGFGWSASASFSIPGSWPSGYYEVRGPSSELVGGFVVRAAAPGSASTTLVSIDLITNQAYNGAGGKSLYDPDRASVVSFNRPGGLPDGREVPLLGWLAGEGIAVECCAAQDLADGDLDSYDCLIVAGHSEYWTGAMRDAVERFVAGGGNLVCLSGNTCYRQVRLEDGGRTLIFYKYAGDDPVGGPAATVAFAEPPVNRPQNTLLGVGFTHASFGATQQAAAYQLHFPGHWAMANVSATATSPFMSYETDAAAVVGEPEGYLRVSGEEGTPATFVPLGTADLRDTGWLKPGFATMGAYRRNGTVFAVGTTDWVLALIGQPGFIAGPAVATITRNVLRRLSARLPLDWEPVGHANGGAAMTAVGTRLYLATTANRLWRRYPVGAEVPWTELGHANNVIAMASDGAVLYAVTSDDRLWWRQPAEADINWAQIGTGPGGTRALACAGGSLHAVNGQGKLMRRSATHSAAGWQDGPALGLHTEITSMTSANDILYATTSTNRLMRTDKDFISESSAWVDILHCNFAVGLAIVEGGLFVATTENRLWLLDLHGLRTP